MSEAAVRNREVKRLWAEPGSKHDALIKAAKIGLPSAVGVLAAFLLTAPLTKNTEVSFILDKNEVETAPERMRVESARYQGRDDKGQPFEVSATQAIQQSSDEPIVNIRGMLARLGLAKGPAEIRAGQGRYNIDRQQVAVVGPVRVSGPEGEQLLTRDVDIDLKSRMVASRGPAVARMPVGQFQAGRIRADLGEKTVAASGGVSGRVELGTFQAPTARADLDTRTVVLDGGVRLKIEQGAVR